MIKTKIGVLLGVLAVSCGVSADINKGLIAYYPFEGSANDKSVNKNHGVQSGGITYVDGVIGKAARFDGVDDYIAIEPKSNVSSIGDFTISVWTYLYDDVGQPIRKGRQYIFDGHTHSNATDSDLYRYGFNLIYDVDSNSQTTIHDSIQYGVGSRYVNAPYLEQNTAFAVNNKWVHHVFIRKGNLDYTYINGKLLKSTYSKNYNSDSLLNMQHTWFIGTATGNSACCDGVNYSYFGVLDDVRIYNRALNGSEISDLANAGLSVSGTVKSLGPHTVTCKNETTGQVVDIVATKATVYNCESKGLNVNVGETASIFIKGVVR